MWLSKDRHLGLNLYSMDHQQVTLVEVLAMMFLMIMTMSVTIPRVLALSFEW